MWGTAGTALGLDPCSGMLDDQHVLSAASRGSSLTVRGGAQCSLGGREGAGRTGCPVHSGQSVQKGTLCSCHNGLKCAAT